MTSKKQREVRNVSKNSSVTSRCVAIVFERGESDNSGLTDGDENAYNTTDQSKLRPSFHLGSDTGAQQTLKDGERFDARAVFDEFRLRNKTCYWNPALVDSVASLDYVGFIEPSTILVRGDDVHLENVRTAWGRRVLKDPACFKITKIGDVNGIEMKEIPQTQFIPLPEALCLIIMELNNSRVVATLDNVCERLKLSYQGLHLPSNQHVYDTLGQLIRERKVFHTGFGYFVVTPDTFRLHSEEVTAPYLFTPWTHLHPMYIPAAFSQPPKQAMRSISCQVDNVEDNADEGREEACDKGTKIYQYEESLKVDLPMPRMSRSMSFSMRPSQDRSRKEERDTLAGTLKRSSSVKGRQEKKKGASLKDPDAKEEKPKEKVSFFSKLFGRNKKKDVAPPELEKPAVEYATFSAQFPPPEWTWYQQQVDKQNRTETWVQQQMIKSGTWHYLNSLPTNSGTGSLHFTTNSVPDRISPVHPPQPQQNQNFVPGVFRRPHKKSHKQKQRSSIVIANTPQEIHSKDQTDNTTFRNSVSQNSFRLSSLPTRFMSSEGDVANPNYVSHPLYNSTPRYKPNQGRLPEEVTVNSAAGAERKDPPGKNRSHKKGHKSKKKSHQDRHSSAYPMSRHVSGMSAGTHAEDISFEYQGRLPSRHTGMGVSHNSGVNCIGLGEEPTVENPYQRAGSYRHMDSEANHKIDRVAHFEHESENMRSRNHDNRRTRSYRHTVDEASAGQEFVNRQSGNCVYQRSMSYRHPVRENSGDGHMTRQDGGTGGHIYANVHVSNPDVRPRVPERTLHRTQQSVPEAEEIQSTDHVPVSHPLDEQQECDQLPERNPQSESSSDRATRSSSSSQDHTSQDSAIDGTESSYSYGTVVNTRPVESKQVDRTLAQMSDMALGDSGFSSPRVSENSKEIRKSECVLTKEQNVCNPITSETKLNNSTSRLDDCSEDGFGRITSDALYENVRINNKEVLNNMRYLHKEINVSSQNLTRQTSAEDGGAREAELEPKQGVVKKFNFTGDFHVVGVV